MGRSLPFVLVLPADSTTNVYLQTAFNLSPAPTSTSPSSCRTQAPITEVASSICRMLKQPRGLSKNPPQEQPRKWFLREQLLAAHLTVSQRWAWIQHMFIHWQTTETVTPFLLQRCHPEDFIYYLSKEKKQENNLSQIQKSLNPKHNSPLQSDL